MSFVLEPPVPVADIDFEREFSTNDDATRALTALRTRLHADAIRLASTASLDDVEPAQALVASAGAYREAWLEWTRERVLFRGAGRCSVRTALFAWHERVIRHVGTTRTHADTSVLYESMAVTLALVAAQQRQALSSSTDTATAVRLLDEAATTLDATRHALLVERMRPLLPLDETDEREPRLLDATFVGALADALRGQSYYVRAVALADEPTSVEHSALLWLAYERFRWARTHAPTEHALADATGRVRQRALMATATAIRRAIADGRAPTTTFGTAQWLVGERARLAVDSDGATVAADAVAEYERWRDEAVAVYDRPLQPSDDGVVVVVQCESVRVFDATIDVRTDGEMRTSIRLCIAAGGERPASSFSIRPDDPASA